jgi:hypothetical protein
MVATLYSGHGKKSCGATPLRIAVELTVPLLTYVLIFPCRLLATVLTGMLLRATLCWGKVLLDLLT